MTGTALRSQKACTFGEKKSRKQELQQTGCYSPTVRQCTRSSVLSVDERTLSTLAAQSRFVHVEKMVIRALNPPSDLVAVGHVAADVVPHRESAFTERSFASVRTGVPT